MKDSIKLKESTILHVPIKQYENNFTFIINNEKYSTNILVADLLSPKLSKYHMIDPTIDTYSINTNTRGNFENILKLINFEEETINENEIPFFIEILNELENTNQHIQFSISDEYEEDKHNNNKEEETNKITKVLKNLTKHMKYKFFFEEKIEEDIKYIASHFYELREEDKEIIKLYDITILSEIIRQEELVLSNEDELVELINELYKKDRIFKILYSYVYFKNVTKEGMKIFINNIIYEDLTIETWNSLCERLSYDIILNENENQNQNNNNNENKSHRYKHINQRKSKQTFSYSNEPFKGIINYLQTKNNIKDEINISYSSKRDGSSDQWDIFNYDGNQRQFNTKVEQNSWICIEFKNHEIKPTSYTIRSGYDSDNLKNFVVEGSNDKKEWKIIDEQNEINYLKGHLSVHTFSIKEEKIETFKYLRIRITGNNWADRLMVQFSAIEFFGELF